MAAACQLAKSRLAVATKELAGPSSLASRVGTAVRAGYIGGIKTPVKGIVGNASWLGFKTLFAQPTQAGVDYIRALGKAALAEGDVSPMQYREVINGTNLAGLDAFKRGWGMGVKEVSDAYKAGKVAYTSSPGTKFGEKIADAIGEMKLHVMDANKASLLLDYTPTQYKNPLAQAMADGAFLLVEAVDRPFYYAAEQMSLTMQARLAAIKAGAKGAAIDAMAKDILKNPTEDMIAQASFDAHHATFKDRGVMAKTAEQVKRGFERASEAQPKGTTVTDRSVAAATRAAGTAAKIGADIALPFTGVPTSVAAKGVALTPLGLLGLLQKGASGAQQSATVANALLGFGGVALGYQWAKDGLITGKLTPAERAENPDRQEYSLNVNGVSIGLQTLGPIAVPLFAGASLASQHAKNPDQSLGEDAMATGRSVLEQTVNSTYAQGIKQLVDAAGDEKKSVASLAGNLVPIPSAITQVSRALDPQPREARTFGEKLMNKTPLSVLLPEATSSTGVVRERTPLEQVANVVSPFPIREQRSSPALDELQRLGVTIGKPARTMQFNNEKAELSGAGMKAITERQGELILPLIERALKDPTYLAKTDEQKQNYWERVIRAQKARAKLPVRQAFSDTTSGFFTGARR